MNQLTLTEAEAIDLHKRLQEAYRNHGIMYTLEPVHIYLLLPPAIFNTTTSTGGITCFWTGTARGRCANPLTPEKVYMAIKDYSTLLTSPWIVGREVLLTHLNLIAQNLFCGGVHAREASIRNEIPELMLQRLMAAREFLAQHGLPGGVVQQGNHTHDGAVQRELFTSHIGFEQEPVEH